MPMSLPDRHSLPNAFELERSLRLDRKPDFSISIQFLNQYLTIGSSSLNQHHSRLVLPSD